MGNGGRSPARFLAPAVLVTAVLVVVLVVTTSLGGDQPSKRTGAGAGTGAQQGAAGGGSGDGSGGESGPSSYEVQAGDTLDAIAEETGVSVEQIQKLNPDVEPEALSTGQELNLRE